MKGIRINLKDNILLSFYKKGDFLDDFYIINFRDYCVEQQNNPINLIQFKAGGN